MKRILLFILVFLPMLASAIAVEIDGICFDLNTEAKTAEVTNPYFYQNPPFYSGSVVIPEKVKHEGMEYSVTSIGNYAFRDCSGLTSIVIPNSVTSIGNRSFSFCRGLASIMIPNRLTSIGEFAFESCTGLTSITIPGSVTRIGKYAFYDCSGLTSIDIPNSVTSIENSTFYNCSGLTSITIPNRVTSIGDHAFALCTGLTSITIPNGVTSIGEHAFGYCTGLTLISIPGSVTSIGRYAFSHCTGLLGMFCYAENVPQTGDYVFNWSNIANATLHVPASSTSAYQIVKPWKNFKRIVALPAQDNYRPLLKEGKVWKYFFNNEINTFEVSRVVDGDTIIGGLAYKKILDNVGGQYLYALREEGKQVYIVYNHQETPSLLYDFSKNKGEMACGFKVADVDTIDIDGAKFRRMRIIDTEWEDEEIPWWATYWIEGVGSECLLETNYRQVGNYYNLRSCQINGRTYTQQELLKKATKPQMAYRPFVEEGKVWKVGYGSRNPIQFVEYYYFEGDTIIDGMICKQMMCQRYVTPDYSDYEVIMRYPLLQRSGVWYEEDKKVYVYDDTNNQFKLKYDFSADANDTVQIYNELYVIGPKQTGGIKGFKGVYRNVMWPIWDEEQIYDERQLYNTTWLEGVGDIEGPIFNVYLGKEYHGGAFLMSCTVGDEVIYFNDEYEDGATPDAARKQRIDFTHTIKTRPKSRMLREEAEASLYGEYNDQQLGINLDPLDETYLVRITDESGNAVYEKTVNAGTIVGLNIDISDYAEGRYTVTVENNDESFTGQFDAQTTSISLTPALSHREGAIYNLQGQRLSSLQKGLNIVDGRKVFVK